jgi:DNA-binding response OmpR family regulator
MPETCIAPVDPSQPRELRGTLQEPRTILLVDDDSDLLRGLSIRCRSFGFEPYGARDAHEAILVARGVQPDVVVLDLGLPDGDGFDVLSALMEMRRSKPLEVIVLTGREAKYNRQRSINLGAAAFVQKPVENWRLLETIDRVARRVHRREDD